MLTATTIGRSSEGGRRMPGYRQASWSRTGGVSSCVVNALSAMTLLVRADATGKSTIGSPADQMRGSREVIARVDGASLRVIPRKPSHSRRLEA